MCAKAAFHRKPHIANCRKVSAVVYTEHQCRLVKLRGGIDFLFRGIAMSASPLHSVRRTVRYPAKIDRGDGSPPRDCTILDISDMEARLVVGNHNGVPEEFTLLLGGGGKRRCRVPSRSTGEIEVRFMSEPGSIREAHATTAR